MNRRDFLGTLPGLVGAAALAPAALAASDKPDDGEAEIVVGSALFPDGHSGMVQGLESEQPTPEEMFPRRPGYEHFVMFPAYHATPGERLENHIYLVRDMSEEECRATAHMLRRLAVYVETVGVHETGDIDPAKHREFDRRCTEEGLWS